MAPASDPAYPADVRAALLAAAEAELTERGVGGLSLRAIAERAGVSRATPKWHFGDRAGLLTAVATQGYRQLGEHLRAAAESAGPNTGDRFTAIGRAYIDFGLTHRELFELMFRIDELHADDPAFHIARTASFSVLTGTTDALTAPGHQPTTALPLLAWAAAHGLVALIRDGALQAMTGQNTPEQATELAHHLAGVFTDSVRGP